MGLKVKCTQLGTQLMTHFGKGMEPIGGGTSPQEVGHSGWALRLYSPALLPVHFLLSNVDSV